MSLEISRRELNGGGIADVTLRGEKALNVVDEACMRQAAEQLAALARQADLRCILVRGVDERAFIGGANLSALHGLTRDTAESFIRGVHELCRAIRTAPVPVIAVMRGYCLGAGLEIAAACDLRIGDQSVRTGMPEVRVGVPSVVEAALLPGLIGWGKARELMLRGNIIDAEEAAAIGLLQHVVAADALDELADAIAADIVAGAPRAIAAQKTLFLDWEEQGMAGAIESGVRSLVAAYDSDEPQRAIEEFFASRGKRLPIK